jgi:hypothetical protein
MGVSSIDLEDEKAQTNKMNRPVHAPTRPEIKGFKDVSQDVENSLIGDIAAVASAILGGGSEVASAASAGAAELQATPLPASASVLGDGTASQSSLLREVNGQIQQATSIVGQIIGDATSIVGSILAAATAPSNIGVLPVANSNSSMNGTAFSSGNLMPSNSSHPTFPPNTTIFAPPCPSPAIAPAMAELTQPTTTPPCPTTITEICTVTETWHSTHYAETATFYSFVANTTITYTEKYRYGIKRTGVTFTNIFASAVLLLFTFQALLPRFHHIEV